MVASPEVSKRMGVRLRPLYSFFRTNSSRTVGYERTLEYEKRGLRNFQHDPSIMRESDIDQASGVIDVFRNLSPCIDADHSMEVLMDLMQTNALLASQALFMEISGSKKTSS